MHAHFPKYEYDDMIEAQYRLVSEGLHVDHLNLVSGVSMGGMHTWLWAEEHPDFVDDLFPLVSQPMEIAGRNRLWRDFAMYLITSDPGYNGGEYKEQPHGVTETITLFDLIVDGPPHMQKAAPTRATADTLFQQWTAHAAEGRDANDLVYALNASRNYNPEPNLERITGRLVAVNAADDFINPPDLGVMDNLTRRVKNGKFVLLPVSSGTHGHGSGGDPALWKQYLVELLQK
jgi:homoserine O-acetyltransferase